MPNIIHLMLQKEENDRISSLKLSLLLNARELLIDSKIKDPFGKVFPPECLVRRGDYAELYYKLRRLIYKGGIKVTNNNAFLKHG